ncbi:hypothetical protein MKZ38_002944 [Zalerion maritima]|uniref:Uncharacterized protein n=1 Tax=Zalerion maritima TaxID=339359 RepID=A0AAD5WQH8_9PEZI|nr:hypothetical protein MKZ38_002944 [Zalerion maritima]
MEKLLYTTATPPTHFSPNPTPRSRSQAPQLTELRCDAVRDPNDVVPIHPKSWKFSIVEGFQDEVKKTQASRNELMKTFATKPRSSTPSFSLPSAKLETHYSKDPCQCQHRLIQARARKCQENQPLPSISLAKGRLRRCQLGTLRSWQATRPSEIEAVHIAKSRRSFWLGDLQNRAGLEPFPRLSNIREGNRKAETTTNVHNDDNDDIVNKLHRASA